MQNAHKRVYAPILSMKEKERGSKSEVHEFL
jgi:hypothetical protein